MFARRFTSKNERGENALLLVQGHSESPETWEITSTPEYAAAPGVRIGAVEITGTAIDRFAELERMAGWVSVKDRLPEEDKRVLIYDDVCREVCVSYLYEGVWHGEAYPKEHDASHWMELPAPPADAE